MESANINRHGSLPTWKKFDWVTFVLYLILVSCGIVTIYAASYGFDDASMFSFSQFSGKQTLWVGLALLLGGIIMLSDARFFEGYAYPIYGAVILLLMVTIVIAPDIKGSRSWIVLGPVSLQPAEFGKFATALALAKLFSSYQFDLNAKLSNYFRALIIIFLPVCLILMQKETGSALVYVALIFVLYREGMSGMVLLSIVCAIVYFVVTIKYVTPLIIGIPPGQFIVFTVVAVVFLLLIFFYCKNFILGRNLLLGFGALSATEATLWHFGIHINGYVFFFTMLGAGILYTVFEMLRHKLQKYMVSIGFVLVSLMFVFSVGYVFDNVLGNHQKSRIKETLGIEENLRGVGYNVNQSKIAIGSGGVTGKGFLNGTQTKLKYVPEQHTDFIFCTIGEERGFIGSVAVLGLFLFLILRIIHIAERQTSAFGRVYAYCVASYFIFHLAINIGMVIGLCPVIGIPLPFFSYGGSALWSFTILLFILLRIDASRTKKKHV